MGVYKVSQPISNSYYNYLIRVINDGGSYTTVPLNQYNTQYDKIMLYNPYSVLFPSSQKNNNLYTITTTFSGFTSTRTSVGNYFDVNGRFLTADNNIARLSYVGSTQLFQGVLIEPSSTNRLLQTLSYSSPWSISGRHQIIDDLFLLNSGKNMRVLIADSLNTDANSMCIRQPITINQGVNTLSFYVKKTTNHGSIGVWGFESGGSYSINFDINTLAVTRPQTSARFTNRIGGVIPLGSDNFYCYEIFTSSVTGTTTLGFSPTTSGSQTMVAGQEISISCIQLEGNYPTSFIPTTATTITRSNDIISSPTLNVNTTQWSVFFEIEYLYDFTNGQTFDVSSSPLIWYFRRFNTTSVNFWNQNDQQNFGSLTFSPANSVKKFRCIISFNGSTINTFINGTKTGDQVTLTDPTPFQNFFNSNTYSVRTLKGGLIGVNDSTHAIKFIALYTYQLDDTTSINLTTF